MLTVAFTGLAILHRRRGRRSRSSAQRRDPDADVGLTDQRRTATRMDRAWWATMFPCLMLFLTVLSFNLIGDWLARRFDIREAALIG